MNVDGFRTVTVIEDDLFVTITGTGVDKLTGKTELVMEANVKVDGLVTATAIGVDGLTKITGTVEPTM